MKKYWTCMAFVRGTAKPDCHQKIEAGVGDFKTLRRAGWRQVNTQNKRVFFKCPVCTPR